MAWALPIRNAAYVANVRTVWPGSRTIEDILQAMKVPYYLMAWFGTALDRRAYHNHGPLLSPCF